MKKILGFMLCTLLCLTGCVFNTNFNNKSSEVKRLTYTSYDNNFIVEVNKGWTSVEKGTLNDAADLELIDSENDKYFLVLMESKEDFTWTYEEYRDHMFDANAEIYQTTVENIQDIKVGEYNCNFIEFDSNLEGIKFYMQIYIVETDNYYGQILTWTLNSKKDEYRNEFLELVKSFKEK